MMINVFDFMGLRALRMRNRAKSPRRPVPGPRDCRDPPGPRAALPSAAMLLYTYHSTVRPGGPAAAPLTKEYPGRFS
jgi:hypothetical protein